MLITRTSIYSQITRTLDVNITEEEYNEWMMTKQPIQRAFPHLSENEREFILSGMTSEEWDLLFSENEIDNLEEEEAF